MKRYDHYIPDEGKSKGPTTTISVLAICGCVIILLALLATAAWARADRSRASDPHMVCTVGDETVFNQAIDASVQVADVITITLDGHAGFIATPDGGECHVSK